MKRTLKEILLSTAAVLLSTAYTHSACAIIPDNDAYERNRKIQESNLAQRLEKVEKESVSMTDLISQQLSKATYNGKGIKLNQANPNICMGIGLWSAKDKLSIGLPVDVMQMLLAATILSKQITETYPGTQPKLLILIADSMAVREGAEQEKVRHFVSQYTDSLSSLLTLLKMRESSQLLLVSEIEALPEYQTVLDGTKQQPTMQGLVADTQHYGYILTQTALISYLEKHRGAGVKVGWLCSSSAKELNYTMKAEAMKNWDELKFDRLHTEICLDCSIQYLYTRAGLKQQINNKNISISESCPYTAYPNDNRYVMQCQKSANNNYAVANISKKIAQHWSWIAEFCSTLSFIEVGVLPPNIIPVDAIKKNNNAATVTKILNYWVNVGGGMELAI